MKAIVSQKTGSPDELERKEFFKNTFDAVADGYDGSAMRFFPESARHISSYLHLTGDEHVLDVATGTGIVALALAKELTHGHVTGIDFSEGMLSQARKKSQEQGIRNVVFSEMDMQSMTFPDQHFDMAVSAFSIFFVEDMKKQLIHIADKVKNGGKIAVTTFSENSFSPPVNLFLERLEKYGIEPPAMTWKRVATMEKCTALFDAAGLHNISNHQMECGYYLSNAADWWYIIQNGGFRGLINQLSAEECEKFKGEHLSEVEELSTGKGIWLEVNVLYTIGTKEA